MATYNNVNYLSQTQQVKKNQTDIETIQEDIDDLAVGPQGTTGPRGPQGGQGNVGPAGPDGTPVSGLELESAWSGSYHEVDILANISINEYIKFVTLMSYFDDTKLYLKIIVDGVDQNLELSTLDFMIIGKTSSGKIRIFYYDETGESTEFIEEIPSSSLIIRSTFANESLGGFSLNEIVVGSTVGPTGPAGAIGPSGSTGPQGAQGIQGLPGRQNLAFLATYEDLDTFIEITSKIMIQCIGGDYDGQVFMKESLEEGDTCTFGPYAVLIEIENNGGTIQSSLQSGVTSINIYSVGNLV